MDYAIAPFANQACTPQLEVSFIDLPFLPYPHLRLYVVSTLRTITPLRAQQTTLPITSTNVMHRTSRTDTISLTTKYHRLPIRSLLPIPIQAGVMKTLVLLKANMYRIRLLGSIDPPPSYLCMLLCRSQVTRRFSPAQVPSKIPEASPTATVAAATRLTLRPVSLRLLLLHRQFTSKTTIHRSGRMTCLSFRNIRKCSTSMPRLPSKLSQLLQSFFLS